MPESEQLQRLRAAFESWNRGDYERALEFMREDVVWTPGGLIPDVDPVYHGREGVARFWRDFVEPWDEISIELEEVLDERERLLLILARFRARGRAAIKVDASFFQLYLYDEAGLLSEFRGFVDEKEARQAARAAMGVDG